MADTATLLQIQNLQADEKIRVTLVNGEQVLGDFRFATDRELHVVRNLGRTGTALLIDGIVKIEQVVVEGPCASFVGSGRRCEYCRYAKHMH